MARRFEGMYGVTLKTGEQLEDEDCVDIRDSISQPERKTGDKSAEDATPISGKVGGGGLNHCLVSDPGWSHSRRDWRISDSTCMWRSELWLGWILLLSELILPRNVDACGRILAAANIVFLWPEKHQDASQKRNRRTNSFHCVQRRALVRRTLIPWPDSSARFRITNVTNLYLQQTTCLPFTSIRICLLCSAINKSTHDAGTQIFDAYFSMVFTELVYVYRRTGLGLRPPDSERSSRELLLQ